MAISDPDSVLIIGAGASADFGLPLGGPLLEEVRQALKAEVAAMQSTYFHSPNDTISGRYSGRFTPRAGLLQHDIDRFPVWQHLWDTREAKGDEWNWRLTLGHELTELAALMENQTSETIDDFIAMNPESAPLVKLAIASVFYRQLYELKSGSSNVLRPLTRREQGQRRNWIHLLINIVRHAVLNRMMAKGQKIRIISFNYDGILETVLDQQFANVEPGVKDQLGHWSDWIEIIHPHGFMCELAPNDEDMKTCLLRWAEAIHVINEASVPQSIESARNKARRWISKARKIYMAGFALSRPNAEMLGLGPDEPGDQRWFVHNYDGNPGLRYAAEAFERKSEFIRIVKDKQASEYTRGAIDVSFAEGRPDAPLTLADWFRLGVPGILPG